MNIDGMKTPGVVTKCVKGESKKALAFFIGKHHNSKMRAVYVRE